MRTGAKTICCGIALIWMQGACAAEVAVSEQGGTIVLESVSAQPDSSVTSAAPVPSGTADTALPASAQQDQAASPPMRAPVKAHYEKVDRANIEKRMDDRAARTQKRKADAEKDAAERAKTQQSNQTSQQGQSLQNGQ